MCSFLMIISMFIVIFFQGNRSLDIVRSKEKIFLDFTGHLVSVTRIQLCCIWVKAALDNT